MARGSLKIINALDQEVAAIPIGTTDTNITMPLRTWGGNGLYFEQMINAQWQIVDVRKIILQ